MIGLVNEVCKQVAHTCLASDIRRHGQEKCSVDLESAPEPNLIVDFDKPGSPLGKKDVRCDYLFVADSEGDRSWVVPLELKKGALKVTKVVKQLHAGASVAERLVSKNRKVEFRPVAVCGRAAKAARNFLKENCNKVEFHGSCNEVRLLICGEPLTKALRSLPPHTSASLK